MTNHQWSDAIDVVTDETGSGAYTVDNTTDDYLIAEDNPTGYTLVGSRAAWYTWAARETTTASASLQVSSSISGQTMTLFRNDGGTWSRIGPVKQSTGTGPLTYLPTMLQDARYYLRIADYPGLTTEGQTLYLNLTGLLVAAPEAPGNLNLPVLHSYAHIPEAFIRLPTAASTDPIRGSARLDATIVGGGDRFDLPALTGRAHMPGASTPLVARPIRGWARIPAATGVDAGLTLTQPADGEVMAHNPPEFIVALDVRDSDASYIIEIQVADNSDFTGAQSFQQSVDGTSGGMFYTPADTVPAAASWRARLLDADGNPILTWTEASTFTISTDITTTVLPVTWTVSPDAARPIHLWHLDPAGAEVGDTVIAYGQGFPDSGHIAVADQIIAFTRWELIAGSGTGGGVIDGAVVDPEHYEIEFLAPDIDGGGPFVVED